MVTSQTFAQSSVIWGPNSLQGGYPSGKVHTTKTKITPEQSNTIVSFQNQTPAYLAGPKGDDSGNGTHHFSQMKTVEHTI